MTAQGKRQLLILFATLFLITVGFGIVFPVMPFFAQNLGASPTDIGIIFGVFALMQFLASPFWGKVSDQLGRRPVFLIGLIGFGISFVIFGLAQSLTMIYVARILGGLLSAAVIPAAMAYVADSTRPEIRARWMGLMGAAMSMGFILGPALGGIAGEESLALPFFIAAGSTFVVGLFAFFFLPESRTSEQRAQDLSTSRYGDSFTRIFTSLKSPTSPALISGFLLNFAMTILFTSIALYANAKFGFDQTQVGIFFVIFAGFGAFCQGLLVNPLIKRFGERDVILWGLATGAVGFLMILLSFNMISWLILSIPLSIGSAIVGPAFMSWISQRTGDQEQGVIMGVFKSYQSLGRVIGPILGGIIFDIMGADMPLVLASVVFLISVVIWQASVPRGRGLSYDSAN